MSNELNQFINNNPVPLLRHFALTNEDALKKQINYTEVGKKSFMMTLIANSYSSSTQKDIIDLCQEYGYSLKTATKPAYLWGRGGTQNHSDYLHLWEKLDDKLLSEVTLSIGKDYLLELQKNVPLLQKAYEKKKFETVKVLDGLGVGSHLYESDVILEVAKQDPEILNFYFTRQESTEDKFNLIKDYFTKKLQMFDTTSGVSDNYKNEELNKYMQKEFPLLPPEEQEELVAKTVSCINIKPFNNAIKAIGKSIKDYEPQYVPIWKYLNEARSHHPIYQVLDDKTPLNSYTDNISYLTNLAVALKTEGYDGKNEGYSRGNQRAKRKALIGKMNQVVDKDFWLTSNPKDNNHPWFHTACKSSDLLSAFKTEWLVMSPNEINYYKKYKKDYPLAVFPALEKVDNLYYDSEATRYEKKEVIQDLLSKTWLYQDETNQYSIEYALKSMPYLFTNKEMNQHMAYLIKLDQNDLFPFEIKESLLYNMISWNNKDGLFKELVENLQYDTRMDWSKFSEKIKDNKSLQTEYAPLLSKIKLDNELEKKTTIKTKKL